MKVIGNLQGDCLLEIDMQRKQAAQIDLVTLQSAIFSNFGQNFVECCHYDLFSFQLRQKRPYLIHFLKLPWCVWSIRVYQFLYFLHFLSLLLSPRFLRGIHINMSF